MKVIHKIKIVFTLVMALAGLLGFVTAGQAAVPDLTAGGVPTDDNTINLGPTGLRGWVYHVSQNTSSSRQILVTELDAGAPAAGIVATNDVILGADGTGANAALFTADARKTLGLAIGASEARTPATLSLLVWRAGVTNTVQLTLRTLGAYSATAPYNCPKSAQILEEGLQYIMTGTNESAGQFSFGTLTLLAANNPANTNNAARQTRARNEARALIPSAAEMAAMNSNTIETTSKITWNRGHELIVLGEYYLQTGDTNVLPALNAYVTSIAHGQSLFGTMGHLYADKWDDGSFNGPMGGHYGVVNSAALPCFYGLLLARQCGSTNALLASAIERASRFFAYFAGRGAIPYGEHEPMRGYYESNGKSGLAALAFALQTNRVAACKWFTKAATASVAEREIGHTGSFFNYLWAPLGAAVGGEAAVASYFSTVSWHFDLARRWDGSFDYDCLCWGYASSHQYSDFRMSTAALLTYALPLRQLFSTGKTTNSAVALTSTDVTEASTAYLYNPAPKASSNLVADLGSWSFVIQDLAAAELAKRTNEVSTLRPQLQALATDTNGTSRVGACYALGKIAAYSSAPTLAALLTDPDNKVRYAAAENLRYLSQSARMSVLTNILTATVSTAQPLLPLNEEDPMHYAHAKLAMQLFYSGNAYGPRGVIYGTQIAGVDRTLLYPAIAAVATTPVGMARSTLAETYRNLTATDVNALADVICDSVQFRAPADKMFSTGVRQGGLQALQAKGIAEGVPLCLEFYRDDTDSVPLSVLQAYAGSVNTVVPNAGVIPFLQDLLHGSYATNAQAALDAIAADTNPVVLTPFKSFQSAAAAPGLNLPSQWTTLRLNARDYAKGDSVFTWRKLHGAGKVTFVPNGTGAATNTAVLFDGTPGQYLFEVRMSDSRGFTEVYTNIAVTLYNSGGTLPPNNPPVADAQLVTAPRATTTPINLTGSDPEGYALTFSVTGLPTHGQLEGTPPYLLYTSDINYTGADSFTFSVMDSEGQVANATVNITVSNATNFPVALYEPFNYPVGALDGAAGGGEVGIVGAWKASTSAKVASGSLAHGSLPTSGNKIGNLNSGSNNFGGARTNNPAALRGNGLLADGATLWFSVQVGFGTNDNANARLGLALATSQFNAGNYNFWIDNEGSRLGSGVGLLMDKNGVYAAHYQDLSAGDGIDGIVKGSASGYEYGVGDHGLIVGKITWGATNDTIRLYQLESDLVLPGSASSALSCNVNQTNFDTLTWTRGGDVVMDEIRFGATFDDVILGNSAMTPDLTGPTPNPMSFATAPTPAEPSSVTMVASTAYDPSGVQYYFTCTAGGGHDSGWQTSATYTDTGLTPGATYAYTVKARDKSPALNATTNSAAATVTIPALTSVPPVIGMPQATAEGFLAAANLGVGNKTYAYSGAVLPGCVISASPIVNSNVAYGTAVDLEVSLGDIFAPTPNPATFAVPPAAISEQAITMIATTASDVSGVEYRFTETSGHAGGASSGWQTSPSYTNTGLAPGTLYTYTVTYRDQSTNQNTTAASAPTSATTLPDATAPTPNPMTFTVAPAAVSATSVAMTATPASDASSVEYYFTCTAGGGHDSGWQNSPNYTDSGLVPNTQYRYTVMARDKSPAQNTTAPSAALLATTTSSAIYWNGSANPSWGTAANWTPSGVPASTNDAGFISTSASGYTLHLGSTNRTINKIIFEATTELTPYTICLADAVADPIPTNATRTLTISGGGITVLAGAHTLRGAMPGSGTQGELILSNSPAFNIAANSSLTFDARLRAGSTANNYAKTGAGTLVLNANNGGGSGWTFSSATTGFTVAEGVLRLAATTAYGNSGNKFVVSAGAALELAGGFTQTINNGAITLNGTGIGGAGALRSLNGTNSLTGTNLAGLILGTASSLAVDAGNLTIGLGVSGSGALTKVGAGVLTLSSNNTCSGHTTISAGTLALTGFGALTNTARIVVAGHAVFDVSGLSSPFTLAQSLSSQTLSNSSPGTVINGTNNCTAGTISLVYDGLNPSFIQTNGGMTLSANTIFRVNHTGSALGAGSYLIISNATAGAVGSVAGSVPAVTVNPGGLATNTTASLQVASAGLNLVVTSVASPVPATNLTIAAAGPASFKVSGQGSASQAYGIYSTTNVALPMTNWWFLGTTNSDATGLIQFLDTQATNRQRFYRFGQ